MQTVINNYIVNSTIVGSAVVQGCSDSSVNILQAGEIGDLAKEVLRIFINLDMRRKAAALTYLYDLEDGKALPMGM